MYSMAGLAEYAVVPATDVFPLTDGLPLEESAVLGCAIFTAYGAVRHGADLRGGERIAVVATGGVGINIIQIAKAFGSSQIIAVDIRDDKLEAATRLGATDVVNAATTDATARVRALTDGKGVDVAFDMHTRLFGTTFLSTAVPPAFLDADRLGSAAGRREAIEAMASYTSILSAGDDWSRIVLLDNELWPEVNGASLALWHLLAIDARRLSRLARSEREDEDEADSARSDHLVTIYATSERTAMPRIPTMIHGSREGGGGATTTGGGAAGAT